ncbi:MAG: NAD+ synthase [Candidatus Omnitrophota bacterium]|jgi:NAD+ synthase
MTNSERENLRIDPAEKTEKISVAIKDVFRKKGFSKAVIGVSGGLDSAAVAFLLVRALGKENVTALIMPYGGQDTQDSEEVVRLLEIKSEKIDISPMVDAYFSLFPEADKVRRGNKMARERMSILYDHSSKIGALVVGTGNRTELDLGYFTLHGDGACAVLPLASLYKTQVIQLAGYLGVPRKVIEKKPTAGLWEGQTDEGEIGASYGEMDLILSYLDEGRGVDEIVSSGHERFVVESLVKRMEINKFKLEGPSFL